MKTSIRSYQHENKESQKPIKNKAGLYRDIIDRMGVKDLWQLLSPVGRRVSIETLEGKVLAIDTSIWITQFIKAMRDEDGKTLKNAHILGTMRRILKLLYNRIRPVFIFDGTAPGLKRRTLQARRRRRESVDGQLRRLDHRALIAKMRRDIIKKNAAAQEREGKEDAETRDDSRTPRSDGDASFVSSFIMPADGGAINPPPTGPNPGTVSQPGQEAISADALFAGDTSMSFDVVEWEDGYNDLPEPKDLSSSSRDASTHRRHRTAASSHQNSRPLGMNTRALEVYSSDSGEEEDLQWDLPLDSEAIDVGVLAALPTQMRKDLIEETRRRERARKRSDYLPVASDPELYSQTQIANFLKTSKLNKKIFDIQAIADGRSEGIRIAAQSNRKYILSKAGDDAGLADDFINDSNKLSSSVPVTLPDGSFVPSTSNAIPVMVAPKGDQSWFCDVCFTRNPLQRLQCEVCSALNPANVEEEDKFADPASTSMQFEEIKDIIEPTVDTRKQIEAIQVAESDFDAVEWESQSSASDHQVEWEAEEREGEEREGEEREEEEREGAALDSAEQCEASLAKQESGYNGAVEDHGEGATTSDANEVASPKASSSVLGNNTIFPMSSAPLNLDSMATTAGQADLDLSRRETYRRAVQTASSLTDWAGRAVQRAIKQHLAQSGAENLLLLDEGDVADPGPMLASEEPQTRRAQSAVPLVTKQIVDHDISFVNAREEPSRVNVKEESHSYNLNNDDLVSDGGEDDEEFASYDPAASKELRDRLARDASVATSEMAEEVMELLRVVGLPYLVAPSEAEAQCAALERLGLVDGIVTEDSDAFLFGAKRIYKNLFQDNKFVEVYDIDDVERELCVDRDCLIAMAHLLGSDYVDGIRGVGIVNASEIVQTFMPRPEPKPEVILRQRSGPEETLVDPALSAEAVRRSADSVASGLGLFRKWLEDESQDGESRVRNVIEGLRPEDSKDPVREETIRYFDDRHRGSRLRWRVPDAFPERVVSEAYLKPQVNLSTEAFSWPVPQLAAISDFCLTRLGWTETEITAKVAPVVARCLQQRSETQQTMYSYYTKYQDNSRFAKVRSKRLQEALFGNKTPKTAATADANPAQKRRRVRGKGDPKSSATAGDGGGATAGDGGEAAGGAGGGGAEAEATVSPPGSLAEPCQAAAEI